MYILTNESFVTMLEGHLPIRILRMTNGINVTLNLVEN
jgi:hypothetical protein